MVQAFKLVMQAFKQMEQALNQIQQGLNLVTENRLLAALLALLIIAVIGFLYSRRKQSRVPVEERVDSRSTKAGLLSREIIIEKFSVRTLTTFDLDRFSKSWCSVQTRYSEVPRKAVVEADHLVREVMTKRGYPIRDFDQLTEFISLEHPQVVENYRLTHAIADRAKAGQATGGELRQAMSYYSSLFGQLLKINSARTREQAHRRVPQELRTAS